MSIALEARVTELERRVVELERELEKQQILSRGAPLPLDLLAVMQRLEALERGAKQQGKRNG